MPDFEALELEKPPQKVFEHKRSEIPDMSVMVNRGAAGIEHHLAVFERLEFLEFA
jgi:hypothetical protein